MTLTAIFSIFSTKFWLTRLKEALCDKPKDKGQLTTFLREVQQRNLLSMDTLAMIEGAIQVSEMHVRDVMIPRPQMVTLELNALTEQLVKTIVESGHSRFPVIGDSRDKVLGIFLAKDMLHYYAKGNIHQFDLREIMRPAIFIPESKRLNVLLREFRINRNHMAIVVDEYGGVAGLVTIEDLLEQIVGEIDDEHDIDEQTFIRSRHDGLYLVRALTPIEEFNEYFNTHFSDEEFDTMSGLLLKAFGHLPKRGERLELEGFLFEVARANSRRIQLLRVRPMTKVATDHSPL
jgi:magnesium and cobalt transporter